MNSLLVVLEVMIARNPNPPISSAYHHGINKSVSQSKAKKNPSSPSLTLPVLLLLPGKLPIKHKRGGRKQLH